MAGSQPRGFAGALFMDTRPLLQMRNWEILFKLGALTPAKPVFPTQRPLTRSRGSFDSERSKVNKTDSLQLSSPPAPPAQPDLAPLYRRGDRHLTKLDRPC